MLIIRKLNGPLTVFGMAPRLATKAPAILGLHGRPLEVREPLPTMRGNSSEAKISRASRAAKKKAAREEDLRLLAEGMSPQKLQQKNSAFPVGMFVGARIENLSSAVGR
ncbi:hypothetical protein [Luteolibacter soli]|uniref:Uncharacterized protein n=1 Tax=Luteolibacter soli TaxID=3135280 RepID=A0ABU9AWH8_9BACT